MNVENFFCSYEGCIYNKKRFFKKKLLLDQHYLNCHSEKKFKCPNCFKQYAIDWQLKYHLKACGIDWFCLTCNKHYKERLSLITHCKRNKHQLPNNVKLRKSRNIKLNRNLIIMPVLLNPHNNLLIKDKVFSKYKPILPKPSNNIKINQPALLDSNCLLKNIQFNKTLIKNNLCQELENKQFNTFVSNQASFNVDHQNYLLENSIKGKISNSKFDTKDTINEKNSQLLTYSQILNKKNKNLFQVKSQQTQTNYSCTSQKTITFNKSTCTDDNLENLFNSKANPLNNNSNKTFYCFENLNSGQVNESENKNLNNVPVLRDVLLSDVSVQTDENYTDLNLNSELLIENSVQNNLGLNNEYLYNLELNIETQANWNFNDNTTQTDDFFLDLGNF